VSSASCVPRDLDAFPTRRSSDLEDRGRASGGAGSERVLAPADRGDAVLVGPDHGVDAVAEVELRQQVRHMGLDRGHAVIWAYERSEEHTSELQSRFDIVCRLLLE